MQLTATVLVLLTATASVLAQTTNGPCVQSCTTTTKVSSQCNGDETGDALAACICSSYRGSNLIACINKCPSDEKTIYASVIPALCRYSLLPGVTPALVTTATVVSTSATGTTTSTQVSTTTARASGSGASSSAVATGGSSGAVPALQAQWVMALGSFLGALVV